MKNFLLFFMAAFSVIGGYALTIESGKVYTIANRNATTTYVKDTGVDIIQMGTLDNACYWRFIPTANTNCFYVQNVSTGRYAQEVSTSTEVNVVMGDDPVEYSVVACSSEGTDMFGLTSTNQSVLDFTTGAIGWNWKGDNTVQSFAAVAGTNHRSFWKIQEVDTDIDVTIEAGSVYTMVNRNETNLYVQDTGDEVLAVGTTFNGTCFWQLEATGTEGYYYVKNPSTGRYAQAVSTTAEVDVKMGTDPVEYVVVDCSTVEQVNNVFGLTSTDHDVLDFTEGAIGWNLKASASVQSFAAKAGTNHRSFWKFTKVDIVNVDETKNNASIINAYGGELKCIKLNRTFNSSAWNSLVLPFNMTAAQISVAFGPAVKVASYTGTTQNADGTYTLNFTNAETITANVPVLIYGATDVADVIGGFTVVAGTPTYSPDGAVFDFVGSYSQGTATEGDYFISSDNNFYKAIGTEEIKATRAVFRSNIGAEAKISSFDIDGEEVTMIDSPAIEETDAAIYNLQGIKMTKDNLPKGIYIKNGSKMIVR